MLIASDLPRQGGSRLQTTQMVGAIRLLLDEQGWKAGDNNVAYQDCDDSTAQAGEVGLRQVQPERAAPTRRTRASSAVIGTFNSGCAAIEIPVLNQAPGGGVLMVSPANTYGCLTEPCAGNEPEKYYPSGKRNYMRVAPSDPNQGAVVAQLMKEQGVKSVYILNDKEAYGLGVAKNSRALPRRPGSRSPASRPTSRSQPNFEALFTKIKGTNPDAVFIGGLVDENSGQLINDKVAVLGPNNGDGQALPAGRLRDRRGLPARRGRDGKGEGRDLHASPVPRSTSSRARAASSRRSSRARCSRASRWTRTRSSRVQAADVVLQAIESSDGTRASIIEEVFKIKVEDGYIGGFEFNENGDVTGASGAVLTFTVYKGTDKLTTLKTATPEANLIDAARKEAAG